MDIDAKLISLRSEQKGFIEPSFATIAGAGPNGAIIHYKAEAATARQVTTDTLLLLDSGAQYDCGACLTTSKAMSCTKFRNIQLSKQVCVRVLQM